MPYYTGAGDRGQTGLCGGKTVSKSSPRINAIGDADELNSMVGVCRSHCKDDDTRLILERVQKELFILGSDLAAPADVNVKTPRIGIQHTVWMEKETDKITKEIGELDCFILPGGSELASKLHLARAMCRRAERAIVALSETESVTKADLPYINRLSSFLFVLARMANERAKEEDIEVKK